MSVYEIPNERKLRKMSIPSLPIYTPPIAPHAKLIWGIQITITRANLRLIIISLIFRGSNEYLMLNMTGIVGKYENIPLSAWRVYLYSPYK